MLVKCDFHADYSLTSFEHMIANWVVNSLKTLSPFAIILFIKNLLLT